MRNLFMISKYTTGSDMAVANDPTIQFIYLWDKSLLKYLLIRFII
jgi:hypothetical protein